MVARLVSSILNVWQFVKKQELWIKENQIQVILRGMNIPLSPYSCSK
jgi:hypothetical protein